MPERFTLEFDYITNLHVAHGWPIYAAFGNVDGDWEGRNPARVEFGVVKSGVEASSINSETTTPDLSDKVNRARVDGRGAGATFVGSIRVAAGDKKLYDAIAEKGRATTQGILFDTGSDRIRPEYR